MLERELKAAEEAVRKACLLCRGVRETLVTAETAAKADRSPVTIADFASQAIVNHALGQAFPDDPIVAEEDSAELRTAGNDALRAKVMEQVHALVPTLSEAQVLEAIDRGAFEGGRARFWTLDPIDGTKGYIRGDQYAVALALLQDGEVILGVLGCPNLPYPDCGNTASTGCLFTARKGLGAAMSPLEGGPRAALAVSAAADPADAVFCESFESGHSSRDGASRLRRQLGANREPVRIDSLAKYALVARGEAGVYLRLPTRSDYREKIWDHAAGWLLVSEAGGRVTDVDGRPIDFARGRTLSSNRGMVVTNGALHTVVLEALKRPV